MHDQLIFGVGRVLCALPLADVVETVRPLPVQPVVTGGGALLGVAVIRGAAVPVVDTARILGDPGARPSRFITTATAQGTVAFATGDVLGVRAVAPDAPVGAPSAGSLVAGVGVLDGRPLFFLRGDLQIDRFLREAVVPPTDGAVVPSPDGPGSVAASPACCADPLPAVPDLTGPGHPAPAADRPSAVADAVGPGRSVRGGGDGVAGGGQVFPQPAEGAGVRRTAVSAPGDGMAGPGSPQGTQTTLGAQNDDMSEKSGACAGLFVRDAVGGG